MLSVFETENALRAAVARLLADPAMTAPMRRQFAFSTLPGLRQDFVQNWRFITPELRCIFDPHPA